MNYPNHALVQLGLILLSLIYGNECLHRTALVVSTSSMGHINPALSAARLIKDVEIKLLTFIDFLPSVSSLPNKPTGFEWIELTTEGYLPGIYASNETEVQQQIQLTLQVLLGEVVPMYEATRALLINGCPDAVVVDSISLGGWIAASEYCPSRIILSKMDFFLRLNVMEDLYKEAWQMLGKTGVLHCNTQIVNQYPYFYDFVDSFYSPSTTIYYPAVKNILKAISTFNLELPLLYINLGTTFAPSIRVIEEIIKLKDALRNYPIEVQWVNKFINSTFVPQQEILCTSRKVIFISGGGSNGINEAFRCQSPLIIWPQNYDQFDQAKRVHGLYGIGFYNQVPSMEIILAAVKYCLKKHSVIVQRMRSIAIELTEPVL